MPARALNVTEEFRVKLVAALLCVLVAACGGDGDEEATPSPAATATASTSAPEPSATPAPSPTQEPPASPPPRPEANAFPADLQADGLALLDEIAALRGIEDPAPVDMFLLTRDQARDFYTPADDEQPDPPSPGPSPTPEPPPLDTRQELYELLGLVPEAVDSSDTPTVQEQEIDNLISIITGFYAPQFDAFYMIETINGGIYGLLARATIVHELTHALQYQTVEVNRIARERARNFDATTALLAVIEGDAVNSEIALLDFSARSTLRQPVCFEIPASRNQGTPYAIERELDVWYEDGLCFVQAVATQDPDGIARIFSDLPTTMEQILHPEKYLAGEAALPVTPRPLDTALGGGWSLLGEGSFGEFGLQNILLNGLPEDRTRVQEAAAGWGGDAWRLYVSGDSRLLQLETAWDAPAEAPQFLDALASSLANLGFSTQVEGTTTTLVKDRATWSLTRRDGSVTVLVANDVAALERARRALTLP
jgi:hypothetical protein